MRPPCATSPGPRRSQRVPPTTSFSSKEAIVSAYYDQVQRVHAEKAREEWKEKSGLRERLGVVLHSKLEILKDDRRFLGALFRYTGDPGHPLSVFGKGTESQRAQSIAIFREAITGTGLSEEMHQFSSRRSVAGASGDDPLLPL